VLILWAGIRLLREHRCVSWTSTGNAQARPDISIYCEYGFGHFAISLADSRLANIPVVALRHIKPSVTELYWHQAKSGLVLAITYKILVL
jgi:hypothetical protein